MIKKNIARVFLDTLPVLTGYIFLGMGFGILLSQAGYNLWWALGMSVFMYAGSGQYLAVELLANHAGLVATAIATLMVNARHMFYGLSLIDTYKNSGIKKPYMIFALTDETYSLVTQNHPPEGMKRHTYCFLVSLFDQIYWIAGCVLGNVIGSSVPISFEGIEFVLTALFVTLFVEQWLTHKKHGPAIIGVGVTVVCLLIFGRELFLIPALVVITLTLIIAQKTGRRKDNEA